MGAIVSVIGIIVMLVGGIMVLIAAFKESIVWGLCSLFIPFVVFVFVAMHWGASKKGFLIWLAGLVICVIGGFLGGGPSLTP